MTVTIIAVGIFGVLVGWLFGYGHGYGDGMAEMRRYALDCERLRELGRKEERAAQAATREGGGA